MLDVLTTPNEPFNSTPRPQSPTVVDSGRARYKICGTIEKHPLRIAAKMFNCFEFRTFKSNRTSSLILGLQALLLAFAGCANPDYGRGLGVEGECVLGTRNCVCDLDDRCEDGLSCLDRLCVIHSEANPVTDRVEGTGGTGLGSGLSSGFDSASAAGTGDWTSSTGSAG